MTPTSVAGGSRRGVACTARDSGGMDTWWKPASCAGAAQDLPSQVPAGRRRPRASRSSVGERLDSAARPVRRTHDRGRRRRARAADRRARRCAVPLVPAASRTASRSSAASRAGRCSSLDGATETGASTLPAPLDLLEGLRRERRHRRRRAWVRPVIRLHVTGRSSPDEFEAALRLLCRAARRDGFVIEVDQVPLLPLAMGNHTEVVSVRAARVVGRYAEVAKP